MRGAAGGVRRDEVGPPEQQVVLDGGEELQEVARLVVADVEALAVAEGVGLDGEVQVLSRAVAVQLLLVMQPFSQNTPPKTS